MNINLRQIRVGAVTFAQARYPRQRIGPRAQAAPLVSNQTCACNSLNYLDDRKSCP